VIVYSCNISGGSGQAERQRERGRERERERERGKERERELGICPSGLFLSFLLLLDVEKCPYVSAAV
jgi:hypothetical protein